MEPAKRRVVALFYLFFFTFFTFFLNAVAADEVALSSTRRAGERWPFLAFHQLETWRETSPKAKVVNNKKKRTRNRTANSRDGSTPHWPLFHRLARTFFLSIAFVWTAIDGARQRFSHSLSSFQTICDFLYLVGPRLCLTYLIFAVVCLVFVAIDFQRDFAVFFKYKMPCSTHFCFLSSF